MRNEERSQPLADGSILEYIVHGEYASKETDTNSRYGAWWMSLRTMVRQVGKEVVEKKLEDFEDEGSSKLYLYCCVVILVRRVAL